MDTGPLRVGFAPGVTPDKWARVWRDRMPRAPLALVPLADRDGVALLRAGELHLCFVRLPVDREGLHLIPLYDEQPVVVVSREHPVSAYDEVDVHDLADEHQLHRPGDPPSALRQAVEGAAAHAGVVLVPMSLARLHHRRDVVAVPVRDSPATTVGLAWRRDLDDPRVEAFIGVVRGRTANSSRGR
jgi:DNA-binding transcriptional LysR family regulator